MIGVRSPARRAFTLLEVLLALALIILLLGAMTGFLWELLERRTSLARAAKDVQAAGSVIERIEADLLAGLAGDSGIGAGVQGTQTSLRLLSRGVWLPADSAAGGGSGGGGAGAASALAAGDLQGSEYVFDPSSARLSARRFSYAGGTASPSSLELVSDRVERVRFRYFDGRAWRSDFDTLAEGKLPVAIEVAVWFTSLGNAAAPVRAMPPSMIAEDAGTSRSDRTLEGASKEAEPPARNAELENFRWGEPDRLRVIIVPDGPQAGWSEEP